MEVDDESETTMEPILNYHIYLSEGRAASEAITFNL